MTPEQFCAGHPFALAAHRAVTAILDTFGPYRVRVSRSQLAYRRRRGFAYLWLPGTWLKRPAAEVVLSVALDRCIDSPRLKQVAHPAPHVWMHHLEVHDLATLDDEVRGWLAEAFASAGEAARSPDT